MADNKVIISDSYYFTADDNQYILYEYGKRENAETSLIFLSEHGKCICAASAVEILGMLK